MLRLSLIIAILAGLAAAGLNFVVVKEKMGTLMTDLADTKTSLENTQKDLAKTKGTLEKTEGTLKKTKKDLEDTEKDLAAANTKNKDLEGQKKDLTVKLKKTEDEKSDAQAKLSQWEMLSLTPDQIKGTIAELKQSKDARAAVEKENQLVLQKYKDLRADYERILGNREEIPPLPQNLKGNIVAVDPKFNFVVVDVGSNQGVVERGELIINRDGRMVGKIKIAKVYPEKSVANIMAPFTNKEILEGDAVLPPKS